MGQGARGSEGWYGGYKGIADWIGSPSFLAFGITSTEGISPRWTNLSGH